MSSKQPSNTSKSSASVTDKARHTGSNEEKAGSGGAVGMLELEVPLKQILVDPSLLIYIYELSNGLGL
ncbi:hypothetical protein PNOK_0755800 [Pyrrhoderma noxium]|uniref:Uncharacterized protein n=1 Tax=Pyrrhoderma noxium TaxID=2282107 RepID=A0A286UD91_9AGAM|nr:hypothetical protein PNOK_0755800 [Pyrrhoderma noxium]